MNNELTLQDRATLYNQKFPKFSKQAPLVATERWLYGVWVIGNDYRSKTGYYGSYPPKYLDRIMSLFPDCDDILQLFSGSLGPEVSGIRFDIKPECEPDVVGDAEKLSQYFERHSLDLIVADPAYSEEDSAHYGTPLVKRNKVVKECVKVLKNGGFLVWLDQVKPMYRKDELFMCGTIGVDRSTNHRVRMVYIWQKIGERND